MSGTAQSKDITAGGRDAGRSGTVNRRRAALVGGCAVVAFAVAFGVGSAAKSTTSVRTTDNLAPATASRTPQHVSITKLQVAAVPTLHAPPKPKVVVTSSTASPTFAPSSAQTATTPVQTAAPPTETTPAPVAPVQTVTHVTSVTPPVTTQQGGLSGG